MKNIDIIDRLPYELAHCLETNCFFDDIPIVVVERGDVVREYEQQMASITAKSGKYGVAVFVLQIVGDDQSQNLQFGPMILKPAFQVIEQVLMNNGDQGTKKSARKVARKIRDVVKTLNITGLISDMRTGTPCITPVELKEADEGTVSYQVNFECLETGHQQMTAVQGVAVSVNATQFMLACATPGAEIWYTLDDSFPFNGTGDDYPDAFGPGKPSTALLYPGQPVNIPPGGCTLRARAYLDGDNYIAGGISRVSLINQN